MAMVNFTTPDDALATSCWTNICRKSLEPCTTDPRSNSIKLKQLGALLLLITFTLTPLLLGAASSESLELRRKQLADALEEHWNHTMRATPEYASILGDKRYNDQVSDASIGAVKREAEKTRYFLAKFRAIDVDGFSEQEILNKRLMIRDLEESVEREQFNDWEMPVNQMGGIHINSPRLVPLLSFRDLKDYQDYLSRLHKWPEAFDQTILKMRAGMADHLMPPSFLIEKVGEQADRIVNSSRNDNPFAKPLEHLPDSISATDRKAIRKEIEDAIDNEIVPAYRRFATFVRREYAPLGRNEVGVWSLPNGAARYAFLVKAFTTSPMTPQAIYQLGLEQVREIEASETEIAKKLGFADLRALRTSIDSNAKLHVHSEQEMLDLYRRYIDQMYGKLPTLFSHLPKARVMVAPIESYRAKESTTGYVDAALDGSRPGRVEVNTYAWQKQTTTEIESTAYHEGVPGHHLQISIGQELKGLPKFRKEEYFGAFSEGWGLYSERLGKDVGFYQDPYSDYGRLEDDMLRAIRLVVDTGLHDRRWSRQQVVDFFHAHSSEPETIVQSETDRYISWPAQALGYKIGQLTILKLREEAKASLGSKFDIRSFHDEVLGAGALPLDVLSERIHEWIARQKQR